MKTFQYDELMGEEHFAINIGNFKDVILGLVYAIKRLTS